jgi:hypothetical protein
MTEESRRRTPAEPGSPLNGQPAPSATPLRGILDGHLYELPALERRRHGGDEADRADGRPTADLDASPQFRLVDRSPWPARLTLLLAGGLVTAIVAAVVVLVTDPTDRGTVVVALVVALAAAVARITVAWLWTHPRRHRGRSRAARTSAQRRK